MRLLIGPSNVGKSTWAEQNATRSIAFAFQFQGGALPARDDVLHYNLLLEAPRRWKEKPEARVWSLLDDPLLARCVAADAITGATVIVASRAALIARARARSVIEPGLDLPDAYPSAMWADILQWVDLSAMYAQLFKLLEDHDIPYRVLLNADDTRREMRPISPRDLDAALEGRLCEEGAALGPEV